MNKIKGYYCYFGEGLLEKHDMTLEEYKQARVEWCTTGEKDFTLDMINGNETTVEDYCNKTGIIRMMFKHPVTKEFFDELMDIGSIPIWEDQEEYLQLNQNKEDE